MQTLMKIERIGDRMVARGLRIKDMLSDGRIDLSELLDLRAMSGEILDDSIDVESVTLDISEAVQVLRLGAECSPDRRLQDRRARLDMLKRTRLGHYKYPPGKEKDRVEAVPMAQTR